MRKKQIGAVLLVLALVGAVPVQRTVVKQVLDAERTIILNPIGYKCVSNIGVGGDGYLVVRYEAGLKWVSYVAFNLSEIPPSAKIESVKLKLQTYISQKSTWVSVFNTSDTGWVKVGFSWENRPSLDTLLATKWVAAWEEWYAWEHSYLTLAVKSGLATTRNIGLALQSYFLSDVMGCIYFYDNAKLEIAYRPYRTESYQVTEFPFSGLGFILGLAGVWILVRERRISRASKLT